jgi:hypothetical protein|tara:strand:- start:719 stop:874 length:156 start_codon:yes stop_codon:yes gene_type:complete
MEQFQKNSPPRPVKKQRQHVVFGNTAVGIIVGIIVQDPRPEGKSAAVKPPP